MNTFRKILDITILAAASVLFLLLVAGALWQVFSRYILDDPSIFTQELLRFALIWTALLGTSYAFGTKQHIALTFVTNKLKGWNERIVRIIIDLFILVFAAVIMVKGGIELVDSTMSRVSPILQIPMGIVYLALPISGCLIIVYQLINYSEQVTKRSRENEKGA